jgi:hypothetical protein
MELLLKVEYQRIWSMMSNHYLTLRPATCLDGIRITNNPTQGKVFSGEEYNLERPE